MITEKDVYISLMSAKARSNGVPYKIPKDIEHIKKKMSEKNRDMLTYATGLFNTTWSNINIDMFMDCGFAVIGKKFDISYIKHRDIIGEYIRLDKVKKRLYKVTRESIKRSFEYINGPLKEFAKKKDGEASVIIQSYLADKIDMTILSYAIYKRYFLPTEDEKVLINYEEKKFRHYRDEMLEFLDYIEELENVYTNKKG